MPVTSVLMAVTILSASGPAQLQIQRKASAGADVPSSNQDVNKDGDESLLQTARLKTTDQALLDFFRKRIQPAPSRSIIEQLAANLASKNPAEADAAQSELLSLGACVVPALRVIADRTDEVQASTRAKLILELVDGSRADDLPLEVAHLLASRAPDGTVKALLDYLPFANSDLVITEITSTLVTVANHVNKPDPAVLAALKDSHAVCRGTAAQILCEIGGTTNMAAVRPLLHDPDASVRLNAAAGLANAYDAEAVTTLIDLLAESTSAQNCELIESFLANLAGDFGPKLPSDEDQTSRQKIHDAWAKWWRDTRKVNPVEELRKRTNVDADTNKVQSLIHKLGDDVFSSREEAQKDLIHLGRTILPSLKEARNNADPEVKRRLRYCIDMIETEKEKERASSLLPWLARLTAFLKPSGAAEAILAYLPLLDNGDPIEEMQIALNVVAFRDGQPEPAVIRALTDKQRVRRAAAAQALCAGGRSDQIALVRPLLNDPDLVVRLKAALALAGARDKAAVPTLVTLVAELPAELAPQAEEYLNQLAGDGRPKDLPEGESKESRKKRSELWSTWWDANKGTVALASYSGSDIREDSGGFSTLSVYHGEILLIQPQLGEIIATDRSGKPRWTINGLNAPTDVRVLTNGHVLVAEQGSGCISERDKHGKVLWEKQGTLNPLSMQQLQNGNIFICSGNQQLVEVDRKGNEVLSVPVNLNISWKSAARKLRDGRMVLYTNNPQTVLQYDKTGNLVKQSPVPMTVNGFSTVLDNGHVIGAAGNTVIECDIDGKEVHRFQITKADDELCDSCRLPNGHTLVLCHIDGKVKCVELDRNWKRIIRETTLGDNAARGADRAMRIRSH